jgi:WhiB family redox-sensing transcriptional regulator
VTSSVLGYRPPPWLSEDTGPLPCGDADPEIFFPRTYGLACKGDIDAAKAACLSCPLLVRCGAWAIPQTDLEGIWAATTPRERRRIRTGKTT